VVTSAGPAGTSGSKKRDCFFGDAREMILNKIIRERSGTIIKTIGDAVMAGFERPQDAVRASIEMIEELSRFNRTASRPLDLKVGIHGGRAIAVRLNDGSTIADRT
jgi:class 3 adenylate cyclase